MFSYLISYIIYRIALCVWNLHYYLGSNLPRCSGGPSCSYAALFADIFMHIAIAEVYQCSSSFCSSEENNNWLLCSLSARQCCGADCSLCSRLLYCNHRKQSQIHISPSFLTFSRAGKDRVWLPDMGLSVFWSAGTTEDRQKALAGFQVLHILSSDLERYEVWDEELILLAALLSKHPNCFVRSSCGQRFTLGLLMKDGSRPAGELRAAAAKSKRRVRGAPMAELLRERQEKLRRHLGECCQAWFSFSLKK